MPYVCDNSRLTRTDDDEPIPPTASDFAYLPAEALGGPSGPAKLRIPTGSEPDSSEEFENPQEARALHLSLKASGVAKVYCQYDGGNDEGFAWVDHAELGSGEKLDMAALAKRLIANGVSARKPMPWQKDWSEERMVQDMLDFPLAANWGSPPRRPQLWHRQLFDVRRLCRGFRCRDHHGRSEGQPDRAPRRDRWS
jgi:hypothetical protein